jgi:hypothetical protein
MRNVRAATLVALSLTSFLTLGSPAARADDAETIQMNKPAERRSGLVFGTLFGIGLAGSSGYPNNATKIGDPNYYSSSGMMTGTATNLLIMGALSDYLNFGFWFGNGIFKNGDWRSSGGGGGLRVEIFPLYSLVPRLKDLAVAGQFGIGTTTLDGQFRPGVSSDGTEAFIGAGVFYEWKIAKLLGGHLALGPSLDYDVITARPIERNSATLGLRLVFYGGP